MNLNIDGDLGVVKAEMARRYGLEHHRRPGPESSLAVIARVHAMAARRQNRSGRRR
jgi:hypothetical protein